MNSAYNRVNTPVLRGPLLFHQGSGQSVPPAYYPPQPSIPTPRFYSPSTMPYALQPRCLVQTSSPVYPYYSEFPSSTVSYQIPIPINSTSGLTYNSGISSKGLSLILIATLILTALDLVIVRPQKLHMLEARGSN